jgi:HD-GYP domain-containing protein (c-di-GMP phosphodiesterase class II)
MSKKATKPRPQVKMPVSDLEIGLYVAQLDKDWLESSFLFQGFLIENDAQIKKLQKECEFVFIDFSKSVKHGAGGFELESEDLQKSKFRLKDYIAKPLRFFKFHPKPVQNSAESRYGVSSERKKTYALQDITDGRIAFSHIAPPKKVHPVEKELSFAKQSHETTKSVMKEFFQQMETGDTMDMLVAEQAVRDSMTSVLRSPDAIQLVTRRKDKSYSNWQQSMNNAVLALSFGRHLNLHDHELITLGLSGLLHDIGYLKMSEADLAQENKRDLSKSHTKIGHDLLMTLSGNWAKTVANVAYCHHEHLDGSGFPRGLIGKQICSYTRIISIIDAYNSLIHPSDPQRKKMSHYEAILHLLDKGKVYYDNRLLNSFHQCIGTYPAGCIVELNSGEIAVVLEVNERYKLKPKIMLLTDARKEKCAAKTVDLADVNEDEYKQRYVIARIISHPEQYGLQEIAV